MKRILSFIIVLTLIFTLAACGVPASKPGTSTEPTSAPVAEQPPTPEAPNAEPLAGKIPADEYERAIWYGFLPDEITTADPDGTIVTWAQYCDMLGRMIKLYDESAYPAWEEMTKAAPDTEMKRDGAMIAIAFAAEALGMDEQNMPDDRVWMLYIGPNWMEEIGNYDYGTARSWDYPVFPWDSPCPVTLDWCDSSNYVGPAYGLYTYRVSLTSGLQIIDAVDGDFRLDAPLTLRDGALMAIRLYESDESVAQAVTERLLAEAAPTAAAQAVLDEAEALRVAIQSDVTEVPISGATYYVSNGGSDENDGLTPETAWATLKKVSSVNLRAGDGVLFERESVFRGYLNCREDVTYSAYGDGAMPVITGSADNYAGAEKWTLYGETPDGGKVWQYYEDMPDCCPIVFNGGEQCGSKARPYWRDGGFTNEDGTPFDVLTGLDANYKFFSPADSLLGRSGAEDYNDFTDNTDDLILHTDRRGTSGKLYLRCDEGNPGEVFESIEIGTVSRESGEGSALVDMAGGALLNNLNIRCAADCGLMGGGETKAYTVQNCEISYCGGNTLWYSADGEPTWGGDGFNVIRPANITNCYLHDNSDMGVTVECTDNDYNLTVSDISITGCLFDRNYVAIQLICFGENMKENGIVYRDLLIADNYMMNCTEGWSGDSHGWGGCVIKCGEYSSPFYSENVVFKNNVMYSPNVRAILDGGTRDYAPPQFTDNRLFLPSFLAFAAHNPAVGLWDNPDGSSEWGTDFDWLYANNCEGFLNEFLGSGNTVEMMW